MKLLLATVLSAVVLAPAWSAPIATLTFRTANATVLDTESLEVWLTLSLDAMSDSITTDSSGFVTPLPSLADIASNLFFGLPDGVNEYNATSAYVNVSFGCGGTFTSGCADGPPYDFTFNFAGPSFASARNLDLRAGSNTDFLFGTFTPTGGRAPAGTYEFPYAAFFMHVFADNDLDVNGNPLHIADIPIADTGAQAAFTREVLATGGVANPEPATYIYILTGLALAMGLKRAQVARQSR